MNCQPLSRLATLALLLALATRAGENRLRNGSFEGTMRYWINSMDQAKYWESGQGALDEQRPAVGRFAAKLGEGELRSTPFPLADGKPVTISLDLRSQDGTTVQVALVQTDRGVAAAGNVYRQSFDVEPGWRRVTYTVTPQRNGESCNWVLVITAQHYPVWVDGVTVSQDGAGKDAYQPRRAVEVAADVPQLPGYTHGGNLLDYGATIGVRAAVSNPGEQARTVTVRWALLDYKGKPTAVPPVERQVALKAGETWIGEETLVLKHNGQLQAKVTVLENGREIDSSLVPVTVLPFRKAATAPDARERIGCSIRGPYVATLAQAIGFRWVRWGTHMGWAAMQPNGPEDWIRSDDQGHDLNVETYAKLGFGVNYHLYSVPAWMKAPTPEAAKEANDPSLPFWVQPGAANLPKDMAWPIDDPRWDDLTVQTAYDAYLRRVAKECQGQAVFFEFFNEPEHPWAGNTAFYTKLAIRTGKVLRSVNPDVLYITNQIDPTVRQMHLDLAKAGGFRGVANGHSWHNYGSSVMGTAGTIKDIKRMLKSGGCPEGEVIFNEGGAFNNSCQDYAAPILNPGLTDQLADATVRSVAELFSAGETKHILFHIGYGGNGRSWWDWTYNGGTEFWDDDGYPTTAPATWNVLIDQIGCSANVGVVKNKPYKAHVFDDLRHGRGVAVVWADNAGQAYELAVPAAAQALDPMGNPVAVTAGKLTLPADGQPFYLFTSTKLPAAELRQALNPEP